MRFANTALPMCYWGSFVDQPPWNDPGGCVGQAKADLAVLAPWASLQYVPMLDGSAPPEQVTVALEAGRVSGATRASLWRRGTVQGGVWAAAAAYRTAVEAEVQSQQEPPDPCLFAHRRLGRRAGLC